LRSAKHLIESAVLAASLLAVPARAQMDKLLTPVTLDQAIGAAKACVGATSDFDKVDARLAADGWGRGAISGAKGDAAQLHFYERKGVVLLLAPASEPSRWTCVEMARLVSPTNGSDLTAAISSSFGVAAKHAPNGEAVWFLEGEVAAVTGDNAKASTGIRIVVAPVVASTQEGSK
jgi:hypothetical protein